MIEGDSQKASIPKIDIAKSGNNVFIIDRISLGNKIQINRHVEICYDLKISIANLLALEVKAYRVNRLFFDSSKTCFLKEQCEEKRINVYTTSKEQCKRKRINILLRTQDC